MNISEITMPVEQITGRKIKATSMVKGHAYIMTNINIAEKSPVSSEVVFFIGCGKFVDGENIIGDEIIKLGMMEENDRYYFKKLDDNGELVTFSCYKKYNSLTISDGYHRLSFNEVTIDIDPVDIDIDNSSIENVEVVKKEEKEEDNKFDADIAFWKKHNDNIKHPEIRPEYIKIVTENEGQLDKFCEEFPNFVYARNNEIFIPFTLDYRSEDVKAVCKELNMDYWNSCVIPNMD